MSKSILKAAVAAACITAMSGAALADEMSANVGFVSDYQYRGYSQTNENMALQGGFDYAHDSGLYVGVWGSRIDWLSKGGLEVDVYGGYANSIGDFGYDVDDDSPDDISIDALIQKAPAEGESQTDIILLTHITVERNANAAIARIEALPVVAGKVVRLRMEELDS